MSRLLFILVLCLHLMGPTSAWAQSITKSPLSYSLKEYGAVLGLALLGGMASWWTKVRGGELLIWNVSALIGELCVSAFAGLITFYLCEHFQVPPLLTAAIVGMAGHAGAKGIKLIETLGQRWTEKRLGINSKPGDL